MQVKLDAYRVNYHSQSTSLKVQSQSLADGLVRIADWWGCTSDLEGCIVDLLADIVGYQRSGSVASTVDLWASNEGPSALLTSTEGLSVNKTAL